MKIGIIINSFNNEKTIKKAILSAARLKRKNNITIVVIDDCSTDNSATIIRKAKLKNLIDYTIFNKKNFGISKSRNIGIDYLKKTDFITFLDGDDSIDNNFNYKLSKLNKNCGLYLFDFKYNLDKKTQKQSFFSSNKQLNKDDLRKYFLKYLNKPNKESLFTTCWSKLYNSKILAKNKKLRFNEKMYLCEDTDFVFRYLFISSKINYLRSCLYTHNLKNNKENYQKATFGIKLKLNHQLSYLIALKSCKKFLEKISLSKETINKKIKHCIAAYTSIYLIRSSLKIRSLSQLILNYIFWRQNLSKKPIFKSFNCYSPKIAGGNIFLAFFIKNKMYFLSILLAYYISNRRYL